MLGYLDGSNFDDAKGICRDTFDPSEIFLFGKFIAIMSKSENY